VRPDLSAPENAASAAGTRAGAGADGDDFGIAAACVQSRRGSVGSPLKRQLSDDTGG